MACMGYVSKTGTRRKYVGEIQRGQLSVRRGPFPHPETLECCCQCPLAALLCWCIAAQDCLFLPAFPLQHLFSPLYKSMSLTKPPEGSPDQLPLVPLSTVCQAPPAQFQGAPLDSCGHCPFCVPVHILHIHDCSLFQADQQTPSVSDLGYKTWAFQGQGLYFNDQER